MAIDTSAPSAGAMARVGQAMRWLRRHPTVLAGLVILLTVTLMAVFAPLFTIYDPQRLDPLQRLKPPSAEHWFGTDQLGRDVFARTVYGSRVSLIVGFTVAAFACIVGLVIGLVSGFIRVLDPVVMRIMDGLMAIPAILLAIAIVGITRSSIWAVVIAVTIPEVPRVVRLVRAIVLTLREQLFVDAAVSLGAKLPRILFVHVMPNTMAPLIVQATYVCASAIIIEAILSFLGAGTPPAIPSWGNMMAEGRTYVLVGWWLLLFPGLLLSLVVLAVNLLGDGLRETLDPRLRRSTNNE
ncbi:ABC transporter permease [Thalassobaculum fulvum]|jgi:peptide/nickel transport system permease protein|uniref:ABC transporter permease n=1 Tax=Thalassobaculum fulvum TaxID=1633335 RepID=A0A918XXP5_9PROT|nr:ABC transporter permease [Thalassobaculum fulvum]GHD61712.1 ABC transporter permease [Thalassobaculum fulvum]